MSEKNGYDGISYREERKTPLFYKILFTGLILWGVTFIGYYLMGGWSSQQDLASKMKAREEMLEARKPKETGQHEGENKHDLAMGKQLFAERCAVCHGIDAKGKIGPDLTRKDFKYGKGESELVETVTKGRPGGMPPFGTQLSHEQVEALVEYIRSL